MKTRISLVLLLSLIQSRGWCETAVVGSSYKAYSLVKEKKWSEAREEAARATKSQPHDAEAWFLLGLSEERLEHLSAALEAYKQYLKLNPPAAAAQNVQGKMDELRPRARHQLEDKFGRTSNGFFVEKSLAYNPNFVHEINGSLGKPFALGFNFGKVFLGYRLASGTFTETINAPQSNSTAYTAITGGGKITHQEIFANLDFNLIEPYESWGNLQLTLPLALGGFMNTLKTTSPSKTYGNVGYDFGLGLGVRGFTRSFFSWYAQGIYHVGIPFWGIREGGQDKGIRNAHNEDVKGNITGFEFSVGVSFLFGEDLAKHY